MNRIDEIRARVALLERPHRLRIDVSAKPPTTDIAGIGAVYVSAPADIAFLLAEVDRLKCRIAVLHDLCSLNLTEAQRRALYHCLHMEENEMHASTGRNCRVKTMRELAKMGLVESAGLAALADGDGFIIYPERYRECWKPTDAGRKFRNEI